MKLTSYITVGQLLLLYAAMSGASSNEVYICDTSPVQANSEGIILSPTDRSGNMLCSVELTGIPQQSWILVYVERIDLPTSCWYDPDTNNNYVSVDATGQLLTASSANQTISYYNGENTTTSFTFRACEYEPGNHGFLIKYEVKQSPDITPSLDGVTATVTQQAITPEMRALSSLLTTKSDTYLPSSTASPKATNHPAATKHQNVLSITPVTSFPMKSSTEHSRTVSEASSNKGEATTTGYSHGQEMALLSTDTSLAVVTLGVIAALMTFLCRKLKGGEQQVQGSAGSDGNTKDEGQAKRCGCRCGMNVNIDDFAGTVNESKEGASGRVDKVKATYEGVAEKVDKIKETYEGVAETVDKLKETCEGVTEQIESAEEAYQSRSEPPLNAPDCERAATSRMTGVSSASTDQDLSIIKCDEDIQILQP